MTDAKFEAFVQECGIEMIMDVAQISRAWHERTMSIETIITHLLYHLGSYEEQMAEQLVDLERRHVQMASDIEMLKKEVKMG